MYTSLNNHETARRRLWTETYNTFLQAWVGGSQRKATDGAVADHAADMSDYALRQFDARFPKPEA